MPGTYSKYIQWLFNVDGDIFSIEDIGAESDGRVLAIVAETRNNGQEDCRQREEVILRNGKWEFVGIFDKRGTTFDRYGNVSGDQILEYLNQNPLPEEAFAEVVGDTRKMSTDVAAEPSVEIVDHDHQQAVEFFRKSEGANIYMKPIGAESA